jgi:hypothetical protein
LSKLKKKRRLNNLKKKSQRLLKRRKMISISSVKTKLLMTNGKRKFNVVLMNTLPRRRLLEKVLEF